MSTATFYLMMTILAATFVLGLILILSLLFGELRAGLRSLRGVATEILCPLSGKPTAVRLSVDVSGRKPKFLVTRCERFGNSEVRCECPCVAELLERHDEVVLVKPEGAGTAGATAQSR